MYLFRRFSLLQSLQIIRFFKKLFSGLDWLQVEQVLAGLAQKPPQKHVILTGRGAPPALIERADLVTEMTLVKHPFKDQGVKAQAGIEY